MASAYDKASLVMLPHATKDGKVYSVKPEDRSGDFTFSRGVNLSATRVNSSGLIEKAKVSLFSYNTDFTNAVWTKQLSTIVADQVANPINGATDADLFYPSNSGNYKAIRRATPTSPTAAYYGISIYAKAQNKSHLHFVTSAGTKIAAFDLSDGSTSTGVGFSVVAESLANDWYRCSVSAITEELYMCVADGLGTTSVTANGTDGIYIWGLQLEYGITKDFLGVTTTTAVVEGLTADLPRLDYSGGASCPSLLLEPSRTNLFEQSEWSGGWTIDNATADYNNEISPEGVQNAVLLTANGGSQDHTTYVETSSLSPNTYTFTAFIKKGTQRYVHLTLNERFVDSAWITATFDLDTLTKADHSSGTGYVDGTSNITDYGNDWYRLEMTGALVNTTTYLAFVGWSNGLGAPNTSRGRYNVTTSGTFYAYGAQLEAGSYPTSYIPTYGTAASRVYEVPTMNPSALVGATEGSWFMNFSDMSFDISGTSGPSVYMGYNQSNYIGITNRSLGNINQVLFVKRESGNIANLHTIISQSGDDKFCFTWSGSSLKLFVNGVKVYDDNTFANFISWIYFILGNDARTPKYDNKQTLLFPTQITDEEAIALTTL